MKEGESKLILKKRCRGSTKAKGAKKSNGFATKATTKKIEKKKEKTSILDFEVHEEREDDKEEDKEEDASRWEDGKVDTLIAIHKE